MASAYFSLVVSGGSFVSALTAAKFGMIQNMRLVCWPSELFVFGSTGVRSAAGVGISITGFGSVAASSCVVESTVLPDCCVCCSGAGPFCLSGSAVWAQTRVGDRRRNSATAAHLFVGIVNSNGTPCWRPGLHRRLARVIFHPGIAPRMTMHVTPHRFCFIQHTHDRDHITTPILLRFLGVANTKKLSGLCSLWNRQRNSQR